MKGKTWIITFYLILTFNGCQSIQIVNNEYSDLQGFYRVTIPGESWEKVKINNEGLAMRNKENNANFAIISHPTGTSKATLDTLYKQLFIGIKERNILKKQYVYINNQRVLHIVLEGELDNLKLRISAYIIKTKDLIYDIVYWSSPDKFDISLDDFERVIKSFKFIGEQRSEV
ncbi:MAG TPA: hypothetical protein ENH85_07475 [Candidatus Scalindua sp.]|nr:hypothetical protein [Candidatus Scalindua sp.]